MPGVACEVNMRFATKFDRWLVVVLVLTGALTCVILPIRFLVSSPHSAPIGAFIPLAIWLIVLPSTLPQYYEVREDGLFLRQGWRKTLIPYESLAELQPMSDSRSAAVFSTDRILVITQAGTRFLIAPAERERFIDQVERKTPQLERRGFGLGFPLSTPTII
jgi:hypothetical protein